MKKKTVKKEYFVHFRKQYNATYLVKATSKKEARIKANRMIDSFDFEEDPRHLEVFVEKPQF